MGLQLTEAKDHYVRVARIKTDGKGHYLGIEVCNCDNGEPDWVPSPDCPVCGDKR